MGERTFNTFLLIFYSTNVANVIIRIMLTKKCLNCNAGLNPDSMLRPCYTVRNASTMSMREALKAGRTPPINPIMRENTIAL